MSCLKALLFCTLGVVATADKSITAAGVTVQVKGQSGKMTLTIPGANASNPDVVEVRMLALRQLDADGNTLGGGGNEKHSFNSFATQSFAFGTPAESTYQGLQVTTIDFDSVLVGSSKVKIVTFIFMENGNLTVGSDSLTVSKGSIKFNVELSSWSWCGSDATCKASAGTGASVELDIEMKGENSAPKSKPKNGTEATSSYELGGGQTLVMLSTYSQDGGKSWTEMPSGYPKVDGSKFTLKFPRWASESILYDPIVQYSGTDGTSTDGTDGTDGADSAGTAEISAASAPMLVWIVYLSLLSIVALSTE